MTRRSGLLFGMVIALGVCAPTAPAGAQNVLVYDDNSTDGRALDACARVGGLTCTRAMSGDFVTRLSGSSWDLVVVDLPSNEPTGAWQSALIAHVTAGGRAIHSQWNSSSLMGIPAAFQATVAGEHDAIPFYRWSSSPLFASPEAVPASFTTITDIWGTNGFYLQPVSPAYAAAGFTMSPATNQAAIVVGNSERTIFNGFLYDDFTGDVDGDGVPDITELLMNEIAFLLGGSAPTGPCVGLAEGASCSTAAGAAGRCRSGGCCTGCWDGTRCQVGTTAAACGVVGAACASCADGDACTSDVCSAGACSNPAAPSGTPCDDSLFCTATDRCDGAGTCVGTGTACDDGVSCTVDTCDEAADACTFTPAVGCTIGGECVGDGVAHPSYPCLVCDPARDMTDWSSRALGTPCGADRCAAGRFYPASTCNDAGACVPSASTLCASGECDAAGIACVATCAETGCPSGEWCAADGSCMPERSDGEDCAGAVECASGHCVDGVCCDGACDGTCERCDLATTMGACTPAPAGMDPDDECAIACDGAGACAEVDAGTPEPDAGSAEPDAAVPTPDAGAGLDAGGGVVSRGGCGCRAAGTSSPGWALALVVAWALAVRARRRRR